MASNIFHKNLFQGQGHPPPLVQEFLNYDNLLPQAKLLGTNVNYQNTETLNDYRIQITQTIQDHCSIGENIDTQIDGQIDRWIYRWMDRWIDTQIDGQMDRWIYRWIDEQIDTQIDGQMDRWIDKQMDR